MLQAVVLCVAQMEELAPLKAEIAMLKEKMATQDATIAEIIAASKQSGLPAEYPWVMLVVGAGMFVTSTLMGGIVMGARKTYNVQYPNLYATPGHHEKADAFNRAQRGHQNMFETMSSVIVMALIGGLVYPRIAAGLAASYCIGNYGYLRGYSNLDKDVAGARYTNPMAVLKPLGMMGCMILSVVACYTMLTQ